MQKKEDILQLIMKNKKQKKSNNKLLLIGIVLISLIGFVVLVSALTDSERISSQAELDNLTSQLNENNYSWLVDYNVSYPSVNVYRENSNELLATFNNVFSTYSNNNSFKKYQIFLTNLSENESQNVPVDIMKMKIKLDEIREKLK